jgi:hypothetical protein
MNTLAKQSTWERLVAYGEENRFGMICLALMIAGCMGGVTMAFGAFQSLFLLVLVVVPTMTTLSLVLSVSPMRWILAAFGATMIIDILVSLLLVL